MKLTKETVDVKKFRKMWMDKVYFKDMSKEFSTSRYWIKLFGKELGLPKRGKFKKDYEKFKKMWLSGASVKDILKETGVSIGYFCQLRIRLGLTKRRAGKVNHEKFKEMWLRGDSRRDIAKEFGIRLDYTSARARTLGLPRRGGGKGPRRKVDIDRFKKMWLSGASAKDIEKEFSICEVYVYQLRAKLSLPKRYVRNEGYRFSKLEYEKKITEYLGILPKKYVRTSELKKHVSVNAISRLLRKKGIFEVYFCLFGRGAHVTGRHHNIFKSDFEGKIFICLNRTSVVRLLIEGCKLPEEKGNKSILSRFLRRYLSEAEKCAVLWNLGKRKWYKTSEKQSIQVDGVLNASRKKRYNAYIRSMIKDST